MSGDGIKQHSGVNDSSWFEEHLKPISPLGQLLSEQQKQVDKTWSLDSAYRMNG